MKEPNALINDSFVFSKNLVLVCLIAGEEQNDTVISHQHQPGNAINDLGRNLEPENVDRPCENTMNILLRGRKQKSLQCLSTIVFESQETNQTSGRKCD